MATIDLSSLWLALSETAADPSLSRFIESPSQRQNAIDFALWKSMQGCRQHVDSTVSLAAGRAVKQTSLIVQTANGSVHPASRGAKASWRIPRSAHRMPPRSCHSQQVRVSV